MIFLKVIYKNIASPKKKIKKDKISKKNNDTKFKETKFSKIRISRNTVIFKSF